MTVLLERPGTVEPVTEHRAPSGDSSVAEIPTLELVAPLAGFPEHRRFTLVRLDELGLLYALRSLDEAGLRFLVMPPAPLFPGYAPELDDDSVQRLGLSSADDATVLLIVTPGAAPQDATVNLLAPIVVNNRTRRAAQVMLREDLPVRAPLRPIA